MKSRTVQESAADLGDKPCIYCGQSLAGLVASDRCPGCGKLAVDSLLGDNLRDAEAPWVRTILRGLKFGVIAHIIFVVAALLLITAVVMTMGGAHRTVSNDLQKFYYYVTLIAWLPLLVGTWLITAPEPSYALIAKRRGAAWLARISVLIGLVAVIGPMVVRHVALPPQVQNILLTYALDGGWMFTHVALWLVIRRIIDRTPRREVRRVLSIMLFVTPLLAVLSSQSLFMLMVQANDGSPPPRGVGVGIGVVQLTHAVLAGYTFLISGKAIRRTIGDWT